MNKHWPRWIYASICKHFDDRKDTVALYFDRYDRNTNWAELRVDGPVITQLSHNIWQIECVINILVTSFLGVDEHNIYKMLGVLGTAYSDICCYRYGDGEDDDLTYLGSLSLTANSGNKVDIIDYGIIAPENRFKRSALEGSFKMQLKR